MINKEKYEQIIRSGRGDKYLSLDFRVPPLNSKDSLEKGKVEVSGIKIFGDGYGEICCFPFAENSQFYRMIMEDGSVFNPYIHRRFLPARVLSKINKEKGSESYDEYVRSLEQMSLSYIIKVMEDELNKLSFLEWSSYEAFEERELMFSIAAFQDFFRDLASIYEHVFNKINNSQGYMRIVGERGKLYSNGYSINGCRVHMATLLEAAELTTYSEMAQKFSCVSFNFIPFISVIDEMGENKNKILSSFKDGYIKAGAYYTIKHLVMFSGYVYKDSPNIGISCLRLKETLKGGISGMGMLDELLEVIKDFNNKK